MTMTAIPAVQFPAETNSKGAFVRQEYSIRARITADGSSGFLARARAVPSVRFASLPVGAPGGHRPAFARA